MAHPKRRNSRARTAKRRTHYKAEKPTFTICSNCGTSVLYHRVCSNCGFYKGKLAIEMPETA